MSFLSNPIYQLESRGRGPQRAGDLRGWLFGRGGPMTLVRLLPLGIVTACIAVPAPSVRSSHIQALVIFVLWCTPLMLMSLSLLISTAISTGRDWQTGRMAEWRLLPLTRDTLVMGKVLGVALPVQVGLAMGWLASGVFWTIAHRRGMGIPTFTVIEWAFMLLDTCASTFMVTCLGFAVGTRVRRPWLAAVAALALGGPLLLMVVGLLAHAFDRALLGGHLVIIGSGWLLGNLARRFSRRELR